MKWAGFWANEWQRRCLTRAGWNVWYCKQSWQSFPSTQHRFQSSQINVSISVVWDDLYIHLESPYYLYKKSIKRDADFKTALSLPLLNLDNTCSGIAGIPLSFGKQIESFSCISVRFNSQGFKRDNHQLLYNIGWQSNSSILALDITLPRDERWLNLACLQEIDVVAGILWHWCQNTVPFTEGDAKEYLYQKQLLQP